MPVGDNGLPGVETAQQGGFVVAGKGEIDLPQDRIDGDGHFGGPDTGLRAVVFDRVGAALGIARKRHVAVPSAGGGEQAGEGKEQKAFARHLFGKVFAQR